MTSTSSCSSCPASDSTPAKMLRMKLPSTITAGTGMCPWSARPIKDTQTGLHNKRHSDRIHAANDRHHKAQGRVISRIAEKPTRRSILGNGSPLHESRPTPGTRHWDLRPRAVWRWFGQGATCVRRQGTTRHRSPARKPCRSARRRRVKRRGVIVKRRTRPDIRKRSLKKGGPYGRED
jgi:hypothetical protein